MFKKILCPVDFSDTSTSAAYNAINFASEIKAEITFIHVIDIQALQNIGDLSGGSLNELDFLIEEEKPILNKLKEECEKKGVKVKTILTHGEPHNTILETIKEGSYDIVIMGTHGRKGLTRAVLGSMAESVVRKSDVPVLLYHYKG
ncbi:MAG: universal stress protein [Deltaproteobacteria bacterium]|jgi:universal stress protein A|nr:universal stress protein [Deltaproteobacteria bacterium]MCL5880420.1 universal stress protein [Deltaproteobacteria bacterium]MDA8303652.1 universal stress protein [Deltaproteobacteria bacterium]